MRAFFSHVLKVQRQVVQANMKTPWHHRVPVLSIFACVSVPRAASWSSMTAGVPVITTSMPRQGNKGKLGHVCGVSLPQGGFLESPFNDNYSKPLVTLTCKGIFQPGSCNWILLLRKTCEVSVYALALTGQPSISHSRSSRSLCEEFPEQDFPLPILIPKALTPLLYKFRASQPSVQCRQEKGLV